MMGSMLSIFRSIGWPELLIIGGILLVFFGSKKVKEFSRGMGTSVKELKKVKKAIVEPVEPKKKRVRKEV